MSAPISPVDICNLALDLLRQNEQISSLDTPESEVEALAARWYDATRQAVLRMFPWNFARKRALLPRNTTAPAFGYTDAYNLPNDFLAPVFIGENPLTDYETDFLVEGGQVLISNSGASTLQVCYIRDVESVSMFDPIFVMLLAAELAVVFGNSITGLNKSIVGMERIRDRWEMKARAKNGQENPPRVRSGSSLVDARRQAIRSATSDGTHLLS